MPRPSLVITVLLMRAIAARVLVVALVATPASSPRPAAQRTAILVSATNAPLRVPGSDGMAHLEYDLIVTHAFPFPVTLTTVDDLVPTGDALLRLEGEA